LTPCLKRKRMITLCSIPVKDGKIRKGDDNHRRMVLFSSSTTHHDLGSQGTK
jgi:hypothetical protein